MPTYARREIVAKGEIGAYHCIARCVRRAFLCGKDPLTGRSFDHRRHWIRSGLQRLAEAFAIDVGGFAVMANHFHVVLRQRPDLAKEWTAEEITRRWRHAFPKIRNFDGTPIVFPEAMIAAEAADQKIVEERRKRLSDLSWFMRGISEPVARRANAEDGCKGRFWEGRFRSVALLDDAAILACTAYVDLNPVRAGLAKTPESSTFTSARERIDRLKAENRGRPTAAFSKADWLAKFAAENSRKRPIASMPWVGISTGDYLKLLDWTGRQVRSDKPGAIPQVLAPIMDRMRIRSDVWTDLIRRFGTLFKRSAGSAENLRAHARQRRRKSLHGTGFASEAFR
jgi:REP element-mobilizing transposase RayT